MKKRTHIFFFFFFFFTSSLVKKICNTLRRGIFCSQKNVCVLKNQSFFSLSVVCEELTSAYVLKLISYEICSSLLLTVFICSLPQSCMFLKAVASCQASGATSIFLFVFLKKILDFSFVCFFLQEKTKERKEERRKFFLLLYSSTSLFLFLFYSSCDLFFSYWGFFSLCLGPCLRSCVLVHSYLIYVLSPFMLHRKSMNLEDIVMSSALFSKNYFVILIG